MTFKLQHQDHDSGQISVAEEEASNEFDAAYRQMAMQPNIGLRNARKQAKLTQVKMAEKVGVSRKTYQLYERGGLPIPSDKLARVAALFEVDIRELFFGKPFPTDRSLKMGCAELGIRAFKALLDEYKDPNGIKLKDDEIERVALVYVRHHEIGDDLDHHDLWECVQLVTGGKYIPDRNGNYDWEYDNEDETRQDHPREI